MTTPTKKRPSAPKKPVSSYFIYCSEYKEEYPEDFIGLSVSEMAKKFGMLWQDLAETQRETYYEKFLMAKKRYYIDLAAYKNTSEYREDLKREARNRKHSVKVRIGLGRKKLTGYNNFILKSFESHQDGGKKKNVNMKLSDLAEKWNKMNDAEKMKFKVSKKNRL